MENQTITPELLDEKIRRINELEAELKEIKDLFSDKNPKRFVEALKKHNSYTIIFENLALQVQVDASKKALEEIKAWNHDYDKKDSTYMYLDQVIDPVLASIAKGFKNNYVSDLEKDLEGVKSKNLILKKEKVDLEQMVSNSMDVLSECMSFIDGFPEKKLIHEWDGYQKMNKFIDATNQYFLGKIQHINCGPKFGKNKEAIDMLALLIRKASTTDSEAFNKIKTKKTKN